MLISVRGHSSIAVPGRTLVARAIPLLCAAMELATLIIAMLVTGAVGGVLAGLLGIGGGIVIVNYPIIFNSFDAEKDGK